MSQAEYLPKVLISHSWKDKKETMVIADGLREINCAQVWIDFENMNPGVDINHHLQSQIKNSDFLVLVWTRNAMGNKNVYQEINWALENNIPIIPCYFHFEEKGEVSSILQEELVKITGKNTLWVEFRNHHNGIMELYATLYANESTRLPKEITDKFEEKHQILRRMQGYNKYLTNYRNIKDKEADRVSWINRIMKEIDTLVDSGLNKEITDSFMSGLYKLETSDPEAFQVLKPKLDAYFSHNPAPTSPATPAFQYQVPPSVLNPFPDPVLERLRNNFLAMVQKENLQATSYELFNVNDLDRDQKTGCIQLIINITADSINLLNQAFILAQQAGMSAQFSPVLNYLTDYFFEVEDYRSDKLGPLGWVDDSYLCFSALQQINSIYYSIFQSWLININFNPYLQYLLQLLDQNEIYRLDNILNARFTSINWNILLGKMNGFTMHNLSFGNQEVNQANYTGDSWGKSWEDQMAERAARLGISLNF